MRGTAIAVAVLVILSPASALAWGPGPPDHNADPDGDKLLNIDEFRAKTNPLNPDTDGGGCWDGWELYLGFDPCNSRDDREDTDGDGWPNYREYLEGTNPYDPNTDGDWYEMDSTDPHPLLPDDRWWFKGGGGIGLGDSLGDGILLPSDITNEDHRQVHGTGNGQGQGQGMEEGNAIGHGQGPGRPGFPGREQLDQDNDGLVEFIGLL